jgi:glycerol-3-phosphate dehydrogenase
MRQLQTEILVIGGGATGTGVVRDLAMRGFKAVLVEKGDLTHGTTGRYHGLLHSGGRYVVKDPQAARECIEENRILRRILPHCIEDTGGLFVVTPWDDPSYAPRFVSGCQQAGIPVEEISISQMLKEEPLLNPSILQCFRVPDASADSFQAADANAESARQYGANILNYHEVLKLIKIGDRVVGALCHDRVMDEEVEIHADLVVSASGAWAGRLAATVGIAANVIPGKGVMIAANHRIVNTVINRCKMPADGDILVPAHTVAVIGTTDVKVDDPDHFAIEPWEVQLMLDEGEKIVPGFKEMRMLRAWAGVRPLYQETDVSDTRDVTRAFVLLDHAPRDGLEGFVTITSGKWTTYRKMAEATVDLVCAKLGVDRPCRTYLEPLPGADEGHHYLGARLAHIEQERAFGQIICECELATVSEVTRAIVEGQAKTIDDVRRDVRLGMGPCQGGFCTYRVAGLLHHLRRPSAEEPGYVEQTNVALRDFLQERWKGLLPILWGQQLRQERLDELIYLSLLNTDHLPGPKTSHLTPELYTPAQESAAIKAKAQIAPQQPSYPASAAAQGKIEEDLLVVGAGLAGLSVAWQASQRGRRVRVIAKGWGSLYWHAGCIDVLGYSETDPDLPIELPIVAAGALIENHPQHPYGLAGVENLRASLEAFQELCKNSDYPLHQSLDPKGELRNWLLPTALGAARPTCLAPETMIAGDLRNPDPMLIISFAPFLDFYPELTADNLSLQGIPAQGLTIEIPELSKNRQITGRVLAEAFDKTEFRDQVAEAIKAQAGAILQRVKRLGLPAVLGLAHPLEATKHLEELLGLPVFEIPTLPASIPGIRLHKILVRAIEKAGGRVFDGLQATSSEAGKDGRLSLVWSEAAARRKLHRAQNFVLATGGLLGGGLKAHHGGWLEEVVFGLNIPAPQNHAAWFNRQFLGKDPHPIYTTGINVNQRFQPIDLEGKPLYTNLYAAGAILASGDFLRERSLDGISLVSGYWIGTHL